jgi:hypothetical protein
MIPSTLPDFPLYLMIDRKAVAARSSYCRSQPNHNRLMRSRRFKFRRCPARPVALWHNSKMLGAPLSYSWQCVFKTVLEPMPLKPSATKHDSRCHVAALVSPNFEVHLLNPSSLFSHAMAKLAASSFEAAGIIAAREAAFPSRSHTAEATSRTHAPTLSYRMQIPVFCG